MVDITNDAELFEQIRADMDMVTWSMSTTAIGILRENIESVVYADYEPKMYRSSHRESSGKNNFYDSWFVEGLIDRKFQLGLAYIDNDPNIRWSSVSSDPEVMNWDSPYHGSEKEDRRGFMSQAIQEGKYYDYTSEDDSEESNWWQKPRDFWNPSIDEFSDIFKRSFEEECFSRNIIVKRK
jgi:hypothetical protein